MKRIILTAILLHSFSSFAQSYLMQNGSFTTCSGQFESSIGFGSGGANTPGYNNNENYVLTFCPSTSGNLVSFNFASCVLGVGDILTVYNGTSTTAPVIGVYDNTTPLLGTISAILANNPNGCITFEFVSDSVGTGNGWTASVSCTFPCQPFEITIDSLSPDTSAGGYIDLCDGDTAYISMRGIYMNNNLNYHQSDSSTTYYWYNDSILIDSGLAITFPPDSIGAFMIQIYAVDTLGCSAIFNYNTWIRVATDPDFSPSSVSQDTICFGQSNVVRFDANSVSWGSLDSTVSVPTTFLPDGSGTSPGVYNNTLTFSMFNTGDTIASSSDIIRFWVDMEHSFLGDLTISMTCPNGSTTILKNFPGGGGRWLGEACDNNNTPTPGIGYIYEWKPTGNTLADMVTHSGACVGCPTVSNPCNPFATGTTLQSDSYNPFQTMNNMIGCPLNGTWTLTIVDQWAIDNGFLFTWGIDFDSTLYPNTNITYDPGIDSLWITPHNSMANILSSSSDSIVVLPLVDDTTYCYDVNVLDGFGCTHDTTICFYVRDICYSTCYNPTGPQITEKKVSCPGGSDGELRAYPDTVQIPAPWTYIWRDSQGNIVGSTVSSLSPDTAYGLSHGSYTLEIIDANGCSSTWNATLGTINSMNVNVAGISLTTCSGGVCDASANAIIFFGTPPYSYLWSSGDTTQTASTLCAGSNHLIVTDSNGCLDTTTFTVNSPLPITTSGFGDTLICISNTATIGTVTTGGTPPYVHSWSGGLGNTATVLASPTFTQTYSVVVTDANNCTPDTGEVTVSVRPPLTIGFYTPDTLCPGDTVILRAYGQGGDSTYHFMWEQGLGNTPSVSVPASTPQFYQVTLTDNCGTQPAIDSVWVQVGGYPPLKVSINDDDTVCIGDPYYLFAKGIGGDGKYHYIWDNGLGIGPTKAVIPTQTTAYSVTVTDECLTPAGIGTTIISVGDFEDFDAWVDTNRQCDPGTFVFGVDTMQPGFSYRMNFGGGFEEVNPLFPIKRTFTKDGCHDLVVELTTEFGCISKKRYPCMFEVLTPPVADFDFNPHSPTVKEFAVDFWDKSKDANYWTWYANGNLISNENKFTHLFPDSGRYNILLIVSSAEGCTDSTNLDLPLRFVTSYFLPTAFTPNGDNNNDIFNIIGEGIQARDYELIIYNRWGDEVFRSTDRYEGWNGTLFNSGSTLPSSTYSYTITFRIHTGRKITKFGSVNLLR